MEHYRLDPYPIPKERIPLYVNEPWLADKTLLELPPNREPDKKEDNVRIYIPMDLNRDAILRRLDRVIYQYGEANEDNEMEFSTDDGIVRVRRIFWIWLRNGYTIRINRWISTCRFLCIFITGKIRTSLV